MKKTKPVNISDPMSKMRRTTLNTKNMKRVKQCLMLCPCDLHNFFNPKTQKEQFKTSCLSVFLFKNKLDFKHN